MKKLKFERPVINRINAGVSDKFGRGTSMQAISHIEDVDEEETLIQCGSPLYVISEKTIRDTYREAFLCNITHPKSMYLCQL